MKQHCQRFNWKRHEQTVLGACAVCERDEARNALRDLLDILDYARDNCKPRGAVGRFLFEVGHEKKEHATITETRAILVKGNGK